MQRKDVARTLAQDMSAPSSNSENSPAPVVAAVIVASGESRRMGFDKLAAELRGGSVLRRTVDVFAACPWVGEIVVVCPQSRWLAAGLAAAEWRVAVKRVDGGTLRRDSVASGLAVVTREITCVHDGARPLVAASDLDRCIRAAVDDGAAALARRITETLRRGDDAAFAGEIVDRNGLWAIETPQCAATGMLRDAISMATAASREVTDETSALSANGVRVRLVESQFPNPKITTPADLVLARALLTP